MDFFFDINWNYGKGSEMRLKNKGNNFTQNGFEFNGVNRIALQQRKYQPQHFNGQREIKRLNRSISNNMNYLNRSVPDNKTMTDFHNLSMISNGNRENKMNSNTQMNASFTLKNKNNNNKTAFESERKIAKHHTSEGIKF